MSIFHREKVFFGQPKVQEAYNIINFRFLMENSILTISDSVDVKITPDFCSYGLALSQYCKRSTYMWSLLKSNEGTSGILLALWPLAFGFRIVLYILHLVPPSWRNSGGRRRFRVTIGRLVAGSIPGRA